MILLAALLSFPLPKTDTLTLPAAPTFAAKGGPCESVAPNFLSKWFMSATVDTFSTSIRFDSMIEGFVFNGNHRSPEAGYLYVRLDDQPGSYLAIDDNSQNHISIVGITMTNVAEGPHSIAFALLSNVNRNLPYGRICFDVKENTKFRFTFDRYHNPGQL